MPNVETKNVAPVDSTLKQGLIDGFIKTFIKDSIGQVKLFKKVRNRYSPVPGANDPLINIGYFISRQTLLDLLGHVSTDEGGVWINFGLGHTYGRSQEIELVFTTTESKTELANNDTGTYCVSTHFASHGPDTPPLTGDPSPGGV